MPALPRYLQNEDPEIVEAEATYIFVAGGVEYPAFPLELKRRCSVFRQAGCLPVGAPPHEGASGEESPVAPVVGEKRRREDGGEQAILRIPVREAPLAVETFLDLIHNFKRGPENTFADIIAVNEVLNGLDDGTYCDVCSLAGRFGFGALEKRIVSADVLSPRCTSAAKVQTLISKAAVRGCQAVHDCLKDIFVEGDLQRVPGSERAMWDRRFDCLAVADPAMWTDAEKAGLHAVHDVGLMMFAEDLASDLNKRWSPLDLRHASKDDLIKLVDYLHSVQIKTWLSAKPAHKRLMESTAEQCTDSVWEECGGLGYVGDFLPGSPDALELTASQDPKLQCFLNMWRRIKAMHAPAPEVERRLFYDFRAFLRNTTVRDFSKYKTAWSTLGDEEGGRHLRAKFEAYLRRNNQPVPAAQQA